MHVNKQSRRRLVGLGSLICTLVLASLTFASVPAGAQTAPLISTAARVCPVLSVANPGPGNTLPAGGVVISGSAYDPAATQGSGIARVDLFLGERDQGGTILGTAIPGANSSDPRAFSVEVQVPSLNRGEDFVAYAISSVSGQQTTVEFPIFVGTETRNSAATPTPIPTETTITTTCPTTTQPATTTTTGAVATAVPSMAAIPAPGVPSTTASTTATNSCPVLSVANPSAGDDVLTGAYVISGVAYDPSAPGGTAGIERVDLFLGERDQGGTILGSAVPGDTASGNPRAFSVQVTVPKLNRGVDFAAYAISSVTGHETAVTFPVFVGVPTTSGAATPTPIPTTVNVTNTCGH